MSAISPVLAHLKHETQVYHERIEAQPRMQALISATLTREHYSALLSTFYGFYTPIEQQLAARTEWQQLDFDFEERRKAPRLAQDLRVLGYDDAALAALPICDELPDLSSFPRALGCLYVLEGATLGGQVISRHLRARLELTSEHGAAFFSSYGPALGPMWRAFSQFITHRVAPKDEDAALAGATATFLAMERWLLA